MVDPHMSGPEERDGISIGDGSPANMGGAGPDHGITCGAAVVDVETMNDDVGDILQGDAATPRDVHVVAAPIDGLEAVDQELLPQPNGHVGSKRDPQCVRLDHCVPQGPLPRIHWVIVPRVRDHVQVSVEASHRSPPEPHATLGQSLRVPARVASPTVIDGIPCDHAFRFATA